MNINTLYENALETVQKRLSDNFYADDNYLMEDGFTMQIFHVTGNGRTFLDSRFRFYLNSFETEAENMARYERELEKFLEEMERWHENDN